MPIVLKSGSLLLLEPSGLVQACHGIASTLPLPTIESQKSLSLLQTGSLGDIFQLTHILCRVACKVHAVD